MPLPLPLPRRGAEPVALAVRSQILRRLRSGKSPLLLRSTGQEIWRCSSKAKSESIHNLMVVITTFAFCGKLEKLCAARRSRRHVLSCTKGFSRATAANQENCLVRQQRQHQHQQQLFLYESKKQSTLFTCSRAWEIVSTIEARQAAT